MPASLRPSGNYVNFYAIHSLNGKSQPYIHWAAWKPWKFNHDKDFLPQANPFLYAPSSSLYFTAGSVSKSKAVVDNAGKKRGKILLYHSRRVSNGKRKRSIINHISEAFSFISRVCASWWCCWAININLYAFERRLVMGWKELSSLISENRWVSWRIEVFSAFSRIKLH